MMKIYYSDRFPVPLPPGHRFPIQKYARLRERICAARLIPPEDLRLPKPASDEQLRLVHSRDYLAKVKGGRLSPREIREIGLPWSVELVERSRRSVGGTIAACRSAVDEGMAVNLAGGTHHAFPDRGQGFCVFNDVAVAARSLQVEGRAKRVVILDCDVHQGNGTAAIFTRDESVFTFSIHGARNYPFRKTGGDLDLPLEDGATDEIYLEALSAGVKEALIRARADLAIYLAGADPFEGDRLGRLCVSKEGLVERDRLIYNRGLQHGLPVATVMAGGYAREIQESVEIHFRTVETALGFARQHPLRLAQLAA